MDSAIVFEARIVGAPQPVDAIGFLDTSGNHLRIVLRRQVIRNIQHDIANDTTD